MADIKRIVEDNYLFLLEARKYFHRHAELSGEEWETSAYIRTHLDEWDVPYEVVPGHTSIVATIKGDNPGKTIAVRGDFDALPIQENTGIDYPSVNDGVMHACGHDVHATYMLGAAKILKDLRHEINGTVKILFQEAEENGQGADRIIRAGLFKDIDEVFGLHASAGDDVGKFTLTKGVSTSYGGGIKITVKGKGGHSSVPHETKNPVIVASEIVSAVSSYAAYGFDSFDQVVLVPTIFRAGTRPNIIPDTAEIQYNIRLLDSKYSDIIRDRVKEIAEGVAHAFQAEIDYEFYGPGTAVNNDPLSVDRAARLIREHWGEDAAVFVRPDMGGEDFSRYQELAPGAFVHVGGAYGGVYRVHHTDKTFIDEEAIRYGEELLLYYIFDYLDDPDIREAV